jgi:hypothetical protein
MSPTLNLTSEEYDCVFLARGFVKSVGAEKPAKKGAKRTTPVFQEERQSFATFLLTDTTFHSIQLRRMETSVTIKSMLQLPATFGKGKGTTRRRFYCGN